MKQRLQEIFKRINHAAYTCGRNPGSIKLVAVSKTIRADRVKDAINAGVTILGENYIQEAREKINELSTYPVSWHFIGHLQSNKAKDAVRLFDLIHTVDSLKLARELNKHAKNINKIQPIMIQINISMESSKSGVSEQDAPSLIRDISCLPNLSIRGLMTVPPLFNSPQTVRPYFTSLRKLRDQVKKEGIQNVSMEELSMGMTGDFEIAIQEGATLVRIGTAIFGKRN